ncbi:MAG: D-alanyl-D-alanine carboxypeptidase [Clostridia bacterium]|nr:D-alanyl-D-alanine carboxypeptidase [Clostridia bacterium]
MLPLVGGLANADGDDAEVADPYAPPTLQETTYAYLYNFENDTELYRKGDINLPVYPTSTVKIMAGITAIEALGDDMDRKITVNAEMLKLVSGNRIGFMEGEVVTAEQMLYAMLVNSANDAAIILAYGISGSIEDFVQLMNDKARDVIGVKATYFTNPTGMHDDAMYTTTADIIKIAKYAYGMPKFMEIVSTQMYLMEETNLSGFRKIYNRNCLLSKYYRGDYYYENALGMNAGGTVQGNYCSVTVARNKDGDLTYLCVIMDSVAVEPEDGSDTILTNYTGAIELFEWAFCTYGYREVLSQKSVVCEVPVSLSSTSDYVTLVPKDSITAYLSSEIDLKNDIKVTNTLEENVKAPVKKGDVLGYAKVLHGDVELGRVELIATADIERSEFLYTLEQVSEFTKSTFFIATVVSIVVLSVAYVLINARMRQKRLRSRVPRQYRR